MTQEITVESKPPQHSGPPTKWQENHGNLLMAFVAIVIVVGACVLVYQQNRFVPPRFPESNMIETPAPPNERISLGESVTITVTGAANDFGWINVAIYDSESTFNQPDQAIASDTVSIVDGEAIWVIPVELPTKFAVVAFHDENSDHVLNRNRLGVPIERYGYSRNARGGNGPPSFKQATMDSPSAGKTINIFIR